MEFLNRTLGCSMDKILVAFLVAEVGLKPECIVECPGLVCYSLEKRMILRARGLMKKDASLHCLIKQREADFVARYIDTHKDTMLTEYNAACSGKIPVVPEFIVKNRYRRRNISCRRKVRFASIADTLLEFSELQQ
uniref:Uncharacterized protein n=1 Tax=Oryza punctata TaxID=4537 RepID=A0A0E0MDM8_ORYPU